MPKVSASRAPRGTNVVYKAFTTALDGFPIESRQAIATAAWTKIKGSLSTYKVAGGSTTTGSTRKTRSTRGRGRGTGRTSRTTRSSETATSLAA